MSAAHTPGQLKVLVRGNDGQFGIESDFLLLDGAWEDIYVCFSGYFGSYGPHVFAAAPPLLRAAERALNYIENTEGELGIALESGDMLRAAIAKAKGGAA